VYVCECVGTEVMSHPYFVQRPPVVPTLQSLMLPGPIILKLNGPSDCSYHPFAELPDAFERPAWWPRLGDKSNRMATVKTNLEAKETPSSDSKDEFTSFTTVGSLA